jgi:hypothetical protein
MSRERLLRIFDAVLPPAIALGLAVIGASLSTLVIATSLAPGGPLVPLWVAWPLFLGCFPVHFRSVRTLLLDRSGFKQRLLATPRTLFVPTVAMACAFALTTHGIVTVQGQPERHGSAYYLRNHTELTRVSRSDYRYAERVSERIFTGLPLLFYLLGILIQVAAPGGRPTRASGLGSPPAPSAA